MTSSNKFNQLFNPENTRQIFFKDQMFGDKFQKHNFGTFWGSPLNSTEVIGSGLPIFFFGSPLADSTTTRNMAPHGSRDEELGNEVGTQMSSGSSWLWHSHYSIITGADGAGRRKSISRCRLVSAKGRITGEGGKYSEWKSASFCRPRVRLAKFRVPPLESVTYFKSLLKTHFYRTAFQWCRPFMQFFSYPKLVCLSVVFYFLFISYHSICFALILCRALCKVCFFKLLYK